MNPPLKLKSRRRIRRVISYPLAVALIVVIGVAGWWYYVRHLTTNFHEVVPGKVYRSAQPTPDELAEWISRYHIRTVVNLRGGENKEYHEPEQKAIHEGGAEMIDLRMAAWREPDTPTLRKLVNILDTAPRPLLIHCHHGVDRTGVASVMAAMAIGGEDYARASKQVSLRKLHVPPRSGITLLLDRYESYCKAQGKALGGWREFRHWVTERYIPKYFNITITPPAEVHVQTGRWGSVELVVKNCSDQIIPFSDKSLKFRLTTTMGNPSIIDSWDKPDGEVTNLRWLDLAPGQSRVVRHRLPAMPNPGRYILRFDIFQMGQPRDTSFGREGARLSTCELIVSEAADSRFQTQGFR